MLEYDMHAAHDMILRLMRENLDLSEAMNTAIDWCEQEQVDIVWSQTREIDYVGEARKIVQWAENILQRQPPPSNIEGFWFGLTNSFQQKQPSCGMYLAGSARFDSTDEQALWVTESHYTPVGKEGLALAPSAVFRRIYQLAYSFKDYNNETPDYANLLDYVLCLSFAGLAVREVCNIVDTSLTLRNRSWRGIATGFDDGDFILLGRLTQDGLQPPEQNQEIS